ncbi:MAG: hydrogenase maturation protease [Actinobacteria bacterium]|nr:hydrogenase maturation protease [Actinomycetota bacterium]
MDRLDQGILKIMNNNSIPSQNTTGKIRSTIIKIIGFGNIYMGDDGIGVRVIEKIKEQGVFDDYDNVEVIDGGTSGVDLIFYLQQADKVIIIDAVDAGQGVGEIVAFNIGEIKDFGNKSVTSFSFHDINLKEVFELIGALKIKKDLKIIGINPKEVGYGEKLSPQVENKIPQIISMVMKETGISNPWKHLKFHDSNKEEF